MTVEITDEMIDAVAMRVDDLDPGNQVRTAHIRAILAAAAPHLRAGIAEEVRNLRSQFHDDAKTAFGRIGSSTQVYLDALDDVLALLKGGAEDDSIVAEKSEAALPL